MIMFFAIFSLIFGACFGSFITMASYRLPLGQDIVFKPSYCPKCGNKIGLLSLIPIFSWIFQGGKCAKCGDKISVRYPLTELATSLMFLISYLKFGLTANTIIFDFMIVISMIMIITDLEHYIILDSMQIAMLILSLIFILFNDLSLFYGVISAVIYFSIISIAGFIVSKIKKRESIGFGDVKFITIAGLILGIELLPLFLFLSGMLGIIFGLIWKKFKKNEYFPFGPALIVSYLFLILYFY